VTNFVVHFTDDQRADMLQWMPRLRRRLLPVARQFDRCYANVSVCMPARVGLLSGKWAKRHHVYANDGAQWDAAQSEGAWLPGNTVAKWLRDVGYRTGLIGKWHQNDPTDGFPRTLGKPVGWDHWRAVSNNTSVNGVYGFQVDLGNATTTTINDHIEDWIRSEVQSFLAGTEPFFLYVADLAPHVDFRTLPADLHTFPYLSLDDLDFVFETDVSDKPSWVQAQTPFTSPSQVWWAKQTVQFNLAADRIVDTILDNIDLQDTVFIYCSDNGAMWGEHNIGGSAQKNLPYEPSVKVPLLAAGPGFTPGVTSAVTCQQDVTATLAAIAGVTPPWTLDGVDLRDVQNNPGSYADRAILLEHQPGTVGGQSVPEGKSIVKVTRKLTRWAAADPNKYEMYDLDTDPDEHTNVAYVGGRLAERNALEAELDALLA
jgi:arylsulfatase A-like enzyme